MRPQAFQPTREQQEIIDHDGSAFVTACPGAGKTRVMTERARRLFADMPAGRGVAFLSFTQGAVFELETRLREEGILPSPVFPSFIGTFDSFVWQFLVAPFGISNCDVRPRLIADIADLAVTPFNGAHPLPLSCFCPVTGTIFAQAAKQRGFDLSQKSNQQIQAYVTAAASIRAGLRTRGQLGFDEARGVALERLRDAAAAPRISAALAARFSEVIVDEAQDCNPDDLHIIAWLRDSGLPVKVVCDPHQSIYEFRGGVTDQLFAFAETFDEEGRKALTGNFRSAPNICKTTAQLRPLASRSAPDEPLGRHKDDATPVLILSYPGAAVPAAIGTTFCEQVTQAEIDLAESPVIAATKASGAAAAGQPRPSKRRDRSVRLAQAVTDFHFAAGFNDMKTAIDQMHHILLELEGRLGDLSYRQYLADNEIEQASWRPQVLFLLRALRFDPSKHADAKAWHAATKELLSRQLTLNDGPSLSQRLKWNNAVSTVLAAVPAATAMPRTIHAVKGMEFPAVCVVTTASTLKSILDYLDTGEPADKAEDARKLYVAASRAEELLVIAAPRSQSQRLATHLNAQGALVEVLEL
ncbi:UvrD-helicase domain-containing protein [Pelagibacterium halotolerans]|uniref:DNA 3'-5' helicase n=1 Tax=Pelagibacterium halotolerans (strain DSM 22347 / JCM 15775 / CGMCC 1.7692 / B2) TaxID=1082931 RepID=G4RAX5_PELHB|nr:UvrD-helicase domain-containing protein [Pelagibacterium halotolerans]AEQ53611.1 Superfamily I DNA and RNA helicases-like protein [Pelagibacterium halotolerans B2]QJR20214.1 ATP-dependent helicase [Pelagibacterium halotolerans]SEA91616.1 Part of AAA domain-containing protein [Pelagibacterium halotolerans]